MLVRPFSFVTRKFLTVSLLFAATKSFTINSVNYSTTKVNMSDNHGLDASQSLEIDSEYPGTAVQRLRSVHERIRTLTQEQLNDDWEEVRRRLLWAGGLRDITDAPPGYGYTGHAFNDFNHCDLTTMLDHVAYNENGGRVSGIHRSNQLGPGVKIASIPELGPGGSWSTCIIGNNKNPPQDVAHLQFLSRIAFKLVWVPPMFTTFVLVNDNGDLLVMGQPTGRLPAIEERMMNYQTVIGGKYARAADAVAAHFTSPTM